MSGEDIVPIVAAAVRGIARPGDVLAVAETAVAISQGRFIAAETIRPSRLAYALSRKAGALATISQPESMQLVIDDVGVRKVVVAAIAHVFGILRRRRGVFYEMLGESIAQIDGYTGTLPPYDGTIVLGPADPGSVAEAIAHATGCGAVIVDANDRGVAKILGASRGIDATRVSLALLHNPHGNGDEQTPVVVLKWRAAGANPLWERAA